MLIIAGIIIWFKFLKPKKGLTTETVKRGDVVEELVLSGEIAATEHANLTFETSGTIAYVGVKEGSVVKKGQVLGKLDTTTLNSAYQTALSTYRATQATVDKIHDDVKNHSSDETFTQRDTRTTAEVTNDKAYEAVIAAEKALKSATLKSPFDGIVTLVANPFPGPFVIYSQTQFEVVNPETLYFRVAADQTEITKLKIGQNVGIILDSYPDEQIQGIIENISFAPDPAETGVVYEIKVAITKNGIDYHLGMTGDAKFILSQSKDVLYVPNKFVKNDKTGKYVLVGNGKKKQYIEVGIEGEERVEVKGINEGEVVYD